MSDCRKNNEQCSNIKDSFYIAAGFLSDVMMMSHVALMSLLHIHVFIIPMT